MAVKRPQPFQLLWGLRSGKAASIADQIGRFVEWNSGDDEQGDGGDAGAADAGKAVDRDFLSSAEIGLKRDQAGLYGRKVFRRGHGMIRHGERIELQSEGSAELFFVLPSGAFPGNH